MLSEYKTLEQQIQELWKARGMLVEQIDVHANGEYGYWKIKAKLGDKKK